ncbi:uncharacterized protein PV06_06411 [Exophiala oligosperma]|uniref:Uncharacterized protein n=1 Tax=Exophiala oligosperma TaxID=215243 RepID=A0A0D2E524_9EURO|nr:uncharacterized protein PV06_06411 [Exophiala oligosperma]KIW42909.1 hypothetical protein PV06_06411 [Exophiala oligosperma]
MHSHISQPLGRWGWRSGRGGGGRWTRRIQVLGPFLPDALVHVLLNGSGFHFHSTYVVHRDRITWANETFSHLDLTSHGPSKLTAAKDGVQNSLGGVATIQHVFGVQGCEGLWVEDEHWPSLVLGESEYLESWASKEGVTDEGLATVYAKDNDASVALKDDANPNSQLGEDFDSSEAEG